MKKIVIVMVMVMVMVMVLCPLLSLAEGSDKPTVVDSEKQLKIQAQIVAVAPVLVGDNEAQKKAARDAIYSMGFSAIPALEVFVENAEGEIKTEASDILNKLKIVHRAISGATNAEFAVKINEFEGELASLWIMLLEDNNDGYRREAARRLGKFSTVKVKTALYKALKENGDNYDVCMYIAMSLADIGELSAIPVLIEQLSDESNAYREMALAKIEKLTNCKFDYEIRGPDELRMEQIKIIRAWYEEYGDIHRSPTSIIRAHIRGYMEDNIDLILDSSAPESRPKLRELLTEDSIKRSQQAVQQIWGVSGAAVEFDAITLTVDQDLGDKKNVDAWYKGKSFGDLATVIMIDDQWYVEWF